MTDREALIALNMTDRIGPVTVRLLVERLGSVSGIFAAAPPDLRAVRGVGATLLASIEAARTVDWAEEVERAESLGIAIITQVDSEYPAALKHIYAPPLALYVKGRLEQRDANSVAVVGTRRPSHYGLAIAERLSFQLAKAGVTVNSGLAEGIDTAAHHGALKGRGRTIAVLGGAHDCLYPVSNADLAERIAESGAVLSEFRLGRSPDKTTFPMRNRIVSGLSKGVLVVEAASRSGALITADEALEQGRMVFAVPGRIDAATARGPHALIKKGAKLVDSVDDILDEFDLLLPCREAAAFTGPDMSSLTDEEKRIVEALMGGPRGIDELTRDTGSGAAVMNAMLISLEIKRKVRMLPGQRVELRV